MEELTGLELNLFERAGYIIRRGALEGPVSGESIPPLILTLCRDILGDAVVEDEVESAGSPGWRRTTDDGLAATSEALSQKQSAVVAIAAWASEASMCVVPGSHLAPLSEVMIQFLTRNPADELVDLIRVHLKTGDAALLSPTLLYQWRPSPDASGISNWIVRRVRPAVAGEEGI